MPDPGSGTATVYAPTGAIWGFGNNPPAGSPYVAPPGADATLVHNTDGTWTLTQHGSGEQVSFNPTGWETTDLSRNGSGFTVGYSSDGATVTSVTSDAGSPEYTASVGTDRSTAPYHVTSFTQSGGGLPDRTVTYAYDSSHRLKSITDAANRVTTFGYDSANRR